MTNEALLGPIVALVAWTILMLFWTMFARFPAMKRAGISLKGRRGGRPGALDGIIDEQAQWPAHNYMHLVEQPTLFYAIVVALILMGQSNSIDLWLTWTYVGLRVAHSLVQATVNVIRYRLMLFALSTLCLLALTIHAGVQLLHG